MVTSHYEKKELACSFPFMWMVRQGRMAKEDPFQKNRVNFNGSRFMLGLKISFFFEPALTNMFCFLGHSPVILKFPCLGQYIRQLITDISCYQPVALVITMRSFFSLILVIITCSETLRHNGVFNAIRFVSLFDLEECYNKDTILV